MECTKVNCPMQAGTQTDNCGENCPWRTTAKTTDLISRTALLELFVLECCGECCCCEHEEKEKPYYCKLIKSAPAIDAAPVVHGRWIKEADRDNRWHCSECKFVVGLEHRFYNYCFNCGSRMDGERSNSMTELDKAIKFLHEQYERAKRIELIHNPLAWALYQTWRHVDEPPKDGEKQ